MEKWRIFRRIDKRFNHSVESFECESRHQAIVKLLDLSKEDPNWKDFSIQAFVDGEWASSPSAWLEAEDIIENGGGETECDFDPPCESCRLARNQQNLKRYPPTDLEEATRKLRPGEFCADCGYGYGQCRCGTA